MKKEKAIKNDKVYIFMVKLGLNSAHMWMGEINQRIRKSKKAPWREIAILGNHTLYNFAEAIASEAFGFMFDHCFGFYSDFGERAMYDSKERYELFTDLEDVEHTPGVEGVKKTKIYQVFKEEGKKMLFYFDYGDGWRFYVTLKKIKEPEPSKVYPIVLKRKGRSPHQYY